jgi:beta-mannosidase
MILLSVTLFLYLYSIHCHVILSSASRTATATATAITTGEHSFRYSLSDPPIRGDSILYLDNNEQYLNANATRNQWQLILPSSSSSSSSSPVAGDDDLIPAQVPGDLLSDLVAANRLPEPYYETNFQSTYFCGDDPARIWTYKIEFDASSLFLPTTTTSHHDHANDNEEEDDIILLVMDGIKMGARIELNQQEIGVTSDQFLRYQFDVTNILSRNATNNNTLLIRFDSNILTDGRFMPCSGGWDWAPFSNCSKTTDTHSASFTKGITKSVYLTRVSSTAITAIVPQTFYKGAYPTTALRDGSHDGFQVQVKIHLWSRPRTHIQGEIQLQGSWGANTSQVVEWMGGDAVVTLSIMAEAKDIRLWWPTGMGTNPRELAKRPMFDVAVHFVPQQESNINNNNSIVVVSDARRIGFRHFALVTGNDTDPIYVQNATGQEGTEFAGMYFRVNGVALWSRGANMIPMDELEGRLNAQAHVQLVQSAVLANMNTLRVWGGGMFLPSAWYDACDEYGILVMQDQMYAQGGHSPKETETQELEIRHNIRLLSNHPSIVIWDGCNECMVEMDKATSIYATFVMRLVAEEDGSRSIWPSCPANGWSSGVERLTSRPIPGKPLTTPNQVPRRIETHGPYVHGGGFPAVNGNDHEPVNPKLPIVIDPIPEEMGVTRPSVFASEFGTGGVMSSFESMSATLDPGHWSLHGGAPPDNCTDGFNRQCAGGNVMAQRNYPCDSIVKAYFQTEQDYFEQVGPQSFQRQLYHCMIGQALQMKSTIEERRSKNELGHLVWQLNEIWPTGGWGSLEYGNGDMAGQVLGGRWKPLHYFYRQSTFADVIATCGGTGVGYIRNDAAFMFHGAVVIHVIHLETGELIDQQMVHKNITLPPGPGSLQVLECPIVDGRTHFLSIDILMYKRDMIIHNTPILLKPPKEFTNRIWCDSGLEWTILGVSQNVIAVEVTATVPVALLVVLTTQAPGRFSDNAFTIVGGSKIVNFHPIDDADMQLFQDSLRIEDLAMNQHNQCRDTETESN